ncbi:MAG TPA: polysaccharide deacetylase family protein [Kofleriaceae bacterium]|nr:polysaccharide deacetylase family protein [Kofleriaceae bacterium]
MRTASIMALAGLMLAASLPDTGIAHAGGWPQPAAGHSASKGPEILFTFDDGPNPKTTPLVLDVLKAHHVQAVFFIVGEMVKGNKKGQALIKRIEAEGHIVASHTMKHKDLCRAKEEAAVADLDDGQSAIQSAMDMPLVWFRTPFGARCKRLEDMLATRRMSHFHWDLDPQEWKHKNADMAFDYVTGELEHSSDRNVLLMHDIHQPTVESLPRILDWIDQENVKRAAIGKKPILIVPPWQIAKEKLAKGLWSWMSDTGAKADPRSWASRVLP